MKNFQIFLLLVGIKRFFSENNKEVLKFDGVFYFVTKNLHAGHRKRVKARFVKEGLSAFEDHQVLELLLFYAVPMRDTNEMAHKMIREFGSLSNVFEAGPEDICRRCGVSENIAILISLVAPLAGRYYKSKWGERPLLNTSSKVGKYAVSLFAGRKYECFYAICLDIRGKLNYAALVHEGTINEVTVYPRLIVEAALTHKAIAVILAHNHPGGVLLPSEGDKKVTLGVKAALEAIAIHLDDHIIVSGDKYYSFLENNVIFKIK